MKFSVAEVLKAASDKFLAENIENPRLDAEILLAHVLKWRIALTISSGRSH